MVLTNNWERPKLCVRIGRVQLGPLSRASELTESRSSSRVINHSLLPRVRINNSALPFSLGTGASRALLVVPGFKSMYDAVKTSLHTLPYRCSWVRPTEKSSDIWYYRTAPSAASRSPQQGARIIPSWLWGRTTLAYRLMMWLSLHLFWSEKYCVRTFLAVDNPCFTLVVKSSPCFDNWY